MLRCDSPGGKAKALPPVRSSAAVRANYLAKIDALILELHQSLLYWITAAWRAEPTLAMDATAAEAIQAVFKGLGKRWLKRFDQMAPKLATYFATKAKDRADGAMQAILKESGFAVKFQATPAAMEAYQAVIGENVALIKSIGSQHLAKVETAVMRSVATGMDMGGLAKELRDEYGLTQRRAALIARDQNFKANSVLVKQRQLELGITKARWRHSAGGRVPRPSHVKADGQVYDVSQGCLIDGEYIQPGEKINCGCVSQPIIEGFE